MFDRKTSLALCGRREPGQAVLRKANDPRFFTRLLVDGGVTQN
jgi:hypothetical protein